MTKIKDDNLIIKEAIDEAEKIMQLTKKNAESIVKKTALKEVEKYFLSESIEEKEDETEEYVNEESDDLFAESFIEEFLSEMETDGVNEEAPQGSEKISDWGKSPNDTSVVDKVFDGKKSNYWEMLNNQVFYIGGDLTRFADAEKLKNDEAYRNQIKNEYGITINKNTGKPEIFVGSMQPFNSAGGTGVQDSVSLKPSKSLRGSKKAYEIVSRHFPELLKLLSLDNLNYDNPNATTINEESQEDDFENLEEKNNMQNTNNHSELDDAIANFANDGEMNEAKTEVAKKNDLVLSKDDETDYYTLKKKGVAFGFLHPNGQLEIGQSFGGLYDVVKDFIPDMQQATGINNISIVTRASVNEEDYDINEIDAALDAIEQDSMQEDDYGMEDSGMGDSDVSMGGSDDEFNIDDALAEMERINAESSHYGDDMNEYKSMSNVVKTKKIGRGGPYPYENDKGKERKDINESKDTKVRGLLEQKVKLLEAKNNKLIKTLQDLREEFQNIALVNVNLAEMTNLFLENATTREDKLNIVKRFDNVKTIQESKNLYSTISSELASKVNKDKNKITKKASGIVVENTVIKDNNENVSPDVLKMRKLMGLDD